MDLLSHRLDAALLSRLGPGATDLSLTGGRYAFRAAAGRAVRAAACADGARRNRRCFKLHFTGRWRATCDTRACWPGAGPVQRAVVEQWCGHGCRWRATNVRGCWPSRATARGRASDGRSPAPADPAQFHRHRPAFTVEPPCPARRGRYRAPAGDRAAMGRHRTPVGPSLIWRADAASATGRRDPGMLGAPRGSALPPRRRWTT
jgi:hypothetical protein